MWKKDDNFLLTITKNADENPLLTALGVQPLRIKAAYDDGNDMPFRDGYIDIKITSFDSKSGILLGVPVENTTGLRLHSRKLALKVEEFPVDEICRIETIEGIIF